MTYAYLTKTFMLNPGYLPSWLCAPTIDADCDTNRLLRILNLRLWVANKIITYEGHSKDNGADVELQSLSNFSSSLTSLGKGSFEELEKKTTPETPIDLNNLTQLERKVYEMTEAEYLQVEQ